MATQLTFQLKDVDTLFHEQFIIPSSASTNDLMLKASSLLSLAPYQFELFYNKNTSQLELETISYQLSPSSCLTLQQLGLSNAELVVIKRSNPAETFESWLEVTKSVSTKEKTLRECREQQQVKFEQLLTRRYEDFSALVAFCNERLQEESEVVSRFTAALHPHAAYLQSKIETTVASLEAARQKQEKDVIRWEQEKEHFKMPMLLEDHTLKKITELDEMVGDISPWMTFELVRSFDRSVLQPQNHVLHINNLPMYFPLFADILLPPVLQVVQLTLDACALTDRHVVLLVNALEQQEGNHQLEIISLPNNQLTEIGARLLLSYCLEEVITRNRYLSIRRIDLQGNPDIGHQVLEGIQTTLKLTTRYCLLNGSHMESDPKISNQNPVVCDACAAGTGDCHLKVLDRALRHLFEQVKGGNRRDVVDVETNRTTQEQQYRIVQGQLTQPPTIFQQR